MKHDLINSDFRAKFLGIALSLILFAAFISFPGCSSSIEQSNTSSQSTIASDKSFSFKDEGSDWRVDFNNDKISALYKDGTRVPENEIDQHKKMIYENLKKLKSDYKDLNSNVHKFYFDMDKFSDDMKKFKKDFDNDKFMHFKLEFDEDEFEKNMEKLNGSLKHLKDKKIELYFDSEDFKEKMKSLEENLKNLPTPPNPQDVDIDVYLDMDAFKDGMKKVKESFMNFNIKIDSSDFDMSELRKNMKNLKKNLKGLKIELHDQKGELKNLNLFLDDLKSELIIDGYLGSSDEEYNLEMNSDKTIVNGSEVKQKDHSKYKELYKDRFDKEIDSTIKIKRD